MKTVGTIRIVSKRKGGIGAAPGETVIDVDRANPVLGNKHVLKNHNNAIERARIIAAYDADFKRDMAEHGPMSRACEDLARRLLNGEQLALSCWCAPRQCHAEIIRDNVFEFAGVSIPPVLTKQDGLF